MSKILLVEDDPNLSKLYLEELQMTGNEVTLASDGKRALELARKEHPDLMIMDVILPEKIGLSVLKELKEDPQTQEIPVVIITNFDKGDNPKKALELGAVAFLSKQQFTPKQLITEALAVLD